MGCWVLQVREGHGKGGVIERVVGDLQGCLDYVAANVNEEDPETTKFRLHFNPNQQPIEDERPAKKAEYYEGGDEG